MNYRVSNSILLQRSRSDSNIQLLYDIHVCRVFFPLSFAFWQDLSIIGKPGKNLNSRQYIWFLFREKICQQRKKSSSYLEALCTYTTLKHLVILESIFYITSSQDCGALLYIYIYLRRKLFLFFYMPVLRLYIYIYTHLF